MNTLPLGIALALDEEIDGVKLSMSVRIPLEVCRLVPEIERSLQEGAGIAVEAVAAEHDQLLSAMRAQLAQARREVTSSLERLACVALEERIARERSTATGLAA